MRSVIGLAALVFVGVGAWRLGGMLSTDAVGMAVGMVFGVLAGLPAALLVLASGRQQGERYGGYQAGYEDGSRAVHLEELQRDARRLLQSQPTQAELHSYMIGSHYTAARPFSPPAEWCEVQPDERHWLIVGEVDE